MGKKQLVYKNGVNEYYVINPRWFVVFIILAIAGVILLTILLILVIYAVFWIDSLNIVSRLFAIAEGALI